MASSKISGTIYTLTLVDKKTHSTELNAAVRAGNRAMLLIYSTRRLGHSLTLLLRLGRPPPPLPFPVSYPPPDYRPINVCTPRRQS